MKKRILSVMIIALSLWSIDVFAEPYFTSNNGVELTEFQYNTLMDILYEDDVYNLTNEDYENLHVDQMIEGTFTYKTQEFETLEESFPGGLVPYAYHETASKKLTLSKGCYDEYCAVTVSVTWKKKPAVASYDAIGIRFENTSFYDSTNDFTVNLGGSYYFEPNKVVKTGNGVADIKKITTELSYMAMMTKIRPTNNAIVFGSYQHAVESVTLSQASNFTFSGNGYGQVFLWPMAIREKYDQMSGVYITLY
ncbi:MAG: hypothetical protein OSJ65_06410 [Bacilli bacterium]|nr:hypothetical protein [Bacilli bacterium]